MSLFDLQDVRIAIGSIATLDLPMVVDLIGTYGLKGPYCTLTTTDWFLQALSVIPRGSWGDVARRFTMIRGQVRNCGSGATMVVCPRLASTGAKPGFPVVEGRNDLNCASPPLYTSRRLAPPPPRVAGIRSGRFDEENPFVQNSSALLVQPDEGVSVLVVDRIGDYLPQSIEKSRVLAIPVGARHKCQQGNPVFIDLTNDDYIQEQIFPSVLAAGGEAVRVDAQLANLWRVGFIDSCTNSLYV
ncbi:hypothetical protein F511_36455 [Dorcoceras hygrometricum]|uniref:Acyl-CoA dehydrogenase-related protein n=1 Tax=Dorcoceras hygrometricum TaxID=472368 RepID=A0A2Z7CTG7_9LAMI|nr:hypothetical protein F511_36455 [Dorcoceras hygrometricum]